MARRRGVDWDSFTDAESRAELGRIQARREAEAPRKPRGPVRVSTAVKGAGVKRRRSPGGGPGATGRLPLGLLPWDIERDDCPELGALKHLPASVVRCLCWMLWRTDKESHRVTGAPKHWIEAGIGMGHHTIDRALRVLCGDESVVCADGRVRTFELLFEWGKRPCPETGRPSPRYQWHRSMWDMYRWPRGRDPLKPRDRYVPLPAALFKTRVWQSLRPSACKLYPFLQWKCGSDQHSDGRPDGRRGWMISVAELGRISGLSPRSVRRALWDLHDVGLIRVQPANGRVHAILDRGTIRVGDQLVSLRTRWPALRELGPSSPVAGEGNAWRRYWLAMLARPGPRNRKA